ncbi:MAG: DUF2147 domain-containing protein [Saprospiraceae bacterium]|nr:DUF2147 domain-containing protein [Saprospiraceae bacterium]
MAFGQSSIVGVWKTIDDETGEPKSHLEIYEKDGMFYGKVVKLLQSPPDTTCDLCPGDKKDQPLMGMDVVWDLQPYKDYWSYGRIMDPNNGKIYKCSVWLKGADQLEVRGYLGVSALGRTQSWYRIK